MASAIPKSFIKELLARTDIVEVVDARIPLRKKGNSYWACCPFHTEKTPSFSVSSPKQLYHCFGCGKSGDAISFLEEYERLNFVEAVTNLAAKAGLDVPLEGRSTTKAAAHYQDLYALMQQVAQFYQQQLATATHARQYLQQRGVNEQLCQQFQLGYAPAGWDHLIRHFQASQLVPLEQAGMLIKKEQGGYYDRFRDRIMFPIHDRQGRIIAFGGRVMDQTNPKYLNSPETPIFHKGSELYGLYHASQQRQGLTTLLIVEGYMDVLALAQYGIQHCVATLGTATTKQHLERLFRYTQQITFCFDGDEAGRTAAWRALQTVLSVMQDSRQAQFLFLPDGEDPDSLVRKIGQEKFNDLCANADTLSQFFFKHLTQSVNLNNLDGRSRLINLATPLIDSIPGPVFQQMMRDELAKMARVGSHTLDSLDKSAQRAKSSTPQATRKLTPQRLTPVSLAIALLLQYPSLIKHVPNLDSFTHSTLRGIDVFLQLVDIIHENPEASTAILVQHWREHPHEAFINQLAAWPHMLPAEGLAAEFTDLIQHLLQLDIEQQIEKLMQKANTEGLAAADKTYLQNLIGELKKLQKTGR